MNIFIKINQDGSAQFVDSANKSIHSLPHFQTATKYALTVKIIDSDNANLINSDTTYSVALGSNVANQLPLAVSLPTTSTGEACLASITTDTNAFRTVINQSKIPGYFEVKGTNADLDVTFRALLPCLLSGAAHAGTDLPEEWVSDYYTKTELDALIGDYTKFNEAIAAAETATTKASEASSSATAAAVSATTASNAAQTATTKASEASNSATAAAEVAAKIIAGIPVTLLADKSGDFTINYTDGNAQAVNVTDSAVISFTGFPANGNSAGVLLYINLSNDAVVTFNGVNVKGNPVLPANLESRFLLEQSTSTSGTKLILTNLGLA